MHESVEFAQVQAQTLKDLLPELNRTDVRILDFGCGNGLLTYYVQDLFWQASIIGIDKTEVIEKTRNQYQTIRFETVDYLTTFEPSSFDLIYVAQVLHHIPKNEHEAITAMLSKLLKPSGYLIIFELNPYNPAILFRLMFDSTENDTNSLSACYAQKLLTCFGKTTSYYYNSLPSKLLEYPLFRKMSTYFFWGSWYVIKMQMS